MKGKKHKQDVLRYELTGIVLLALCALSLGRLGLVGRYLDVAFIYLAGSWSFLLPIFIGYAALYMMIQRSTFAWTGRHMGLLVLLITFLTGMELDLYQQTTPFGAATLFGSTLNAIEDMSAPLLGPSLATPALLHGAGGGLIGYAFFSASHYLFSTLGTALMLVIGTIVGLALLFQVSLVDIAARGTRFMESKLEQLWRACAGYVAVLFGKSTKTPPKRAANRQAAKPDRRARNSSAVVVDAEVVSDEDADEPLTTAPLVRDFAMETQPDSGPSLEQVGNQLVMHYPEVRPKPKHTAAEPKKDEMYPVGVPVRDESYELPPLNLFSLPNPRRGGFDSRSAQDNARKLESTLESFGVQAKVLEINRGPTVTRYEVQPAVGVKVSRIVSLTDDIALALAARQVRIEAPIPGKAAIGIEVPNLEVSVVSLREVMETPEFQDPGAGKLSIALGRDISGAPIVANLQRMPHLLVAGATGAGKSVCINGIVASILVKAKPHEVKLLMIDPKMVELSGYNGIPHLLAPVVTDPRKAALALRKVVQEMENRYQQFADRGARDVERYNQMLRAEGLDPLPYIVVIIDELADLMMVAPGDVEDAICRIAQMARAAGIHLIVATQRPSVDVITGLIKANIPSRIAFTVSSMADSRTILDSGGAEKLLGRGDMLYLPVGAAKPVRVQGVYVAEEEIERLVEYVKTQQNAVYSVDLNHVEEELAEDDEDRPDDIFVDAVDLVVDSGQASVSMIQRRFRVGYARAARIVDQMEQRGIVGPFEGSKPREVLIDAERWRAMKTSYQTSKEA